MKVHTKELFRKIEKLTKERMRQEKVVSLGEYRDTSKILVPQRILLIEDDETIRKALKRSFEDEGFEVVGVADGTQLNQVLDSQPIDLIMLDVGLPWVNGFELAELMKADADLKSIPLVFISGRTNEEDVKRGFKVGADDYITKPFDLGKVKKTIRTLLQLASKN